METILGIDLGTTNSVVSVLRNGEATVLPVEGDQSVLPSAVGLDAEGNLLIGTAARNQSMSAPDRTVLSIKRKIGKDIRLSIGTREFSPQEVSAVILRTLKERAEKQLGHPVAKAVITVPAFFNDNQRTATREAGELAGLEVIRIINEPTAASLTYEPNKSELERLLVYDLGGGTFDVSIVQIEQGVVEVLSSHGDTELGGDDFDRLLLDHICQRFCEEQQDVDLRNIPTARARLIRAAEDAKKRLSSEAYTTIEEAFIAEHQGNPLNLEMTIDRSEYEELIEPLLQKTIENVDASLADANMLAKDIDKVILVGGSSRTPLVHQLLEEQLGQKPHLNVDPDLCVSLGAAIQGGLIAGLEVGPVLVDITPHTLGVRVLGFQDGMRTDRIFSPLIHRNTSLPATRSDLYQTCYPGQDEVRIDVYQGEDPDVTFNEQIGSFVLEGLNEEADEKNQILVRFDLDLDGTLTVTAVERETSLDKRLTIDNAITRFHAADRDEAKQHLADLFGIELNADDTSSIDDLPEPIRKRLQRSRQLLSKAGQLVEKAPEEDVVEIKQLVEQLHAAMSDNSEQEMDQLGEKLEDVLFYLEDA